MSLPLITHSALTKVYSSLVPGPSQPMDTIPTPGELRVDTNGKMYKFVKNTFGSDLAVGNVVVRDVANGKSNEVTRTITAALNLMAGVAMGAIPATTGYGWIQVLGDNDACLLEGTVAIALGDSLKGVNAQLYAVKDQAVGTNPTYTRHLVAREAYSTAAAANKKVSVHCL